MGFIVQIVRPACGRRWNQKLMPDLRLELTRHVTSRPAAVLFDMDGLLIDSERLALASRRRHAASVIAGPFPIRWPIGDRSRLGRDSGHVLLPALGDGRFGLSFWDAWLANYRDRVGAGVPAKTGATHWSAARRKMLTLCRCHFDRDRARTPQTSKGRFAAVFRRCGRARYGGSRQSTGHRLIFCLLDLPHRCLGAAVCADAPALQVPDVAADSACR